MIDEKILRYAHVKSWDKLREELNLGEPFWLETSRKPDLTKLCPTNGQIKIFYNPKGGRLASLTTVVHKDGGSMIAYLQGTIVPYKARRKYTKNKIVLGVCHESFHNAMGEVSPIFYILSTYWKMYSQGKDEKKIGKILVAIQDHVAWGFSRNLASDFGISDSEALKIMISCSSKYRTMPYRMAVDSVRDQDKIFEGITVADFAETPWSSLHDLPSKYKEMYNTANRLFQQYKNRITQVYKKIINGRWVKIYPKAQ